MCGIFGIWNFDGKPVDLSAVQQATNSLRHRGPDDEGYLLVNTQSGKIQPCAGAYSTPGLGLPAIDGFFGEPFNLAFGFRRLAILDLSPAGHQPMPSADGRFWIVFNGEIYNYIELKSELGAYGHRFNTGTDTEVILAAYHQWGPDCLHHFNGMWALAIWDHAERSLFLARDRFGIKPLVYTASKNAQSFTFASEIKALITAKSVDFQPSPIAMARYVAFQVLPSQRNGNTFFQNVDSLPAGHHALVRSPELTRHRYWALPEANGGRGASEAEIIDQYRELFVDAVRLRLRSDVPVGSCLSGGLDSSSIVAAAGYLMQSEHSLSLEMLSERQQTFSAVYSIDGEWNERNYVDKVLAHTAAGGNFTSPTSERLWEVLDSIAWHQEEPFISTSIFAQWCVMELARRRGVTVLLDGQGADEIFGGYPRVLPLYFKELVGQGRLLRAFQAAKDISRNLNVDAHMYLKWAIKQSLPFKSVGLQNHSDVESAITKSGLSFDLKKTLRESQDSNHQNGSFMNRSTFQDCLRDFIYEDSLPHVLRHEDRNSMAFSLEARIPFLDFRLVEFVFKSANSFLIRSGWTKWLQRMAIRNLLPAEIVWRRGKVGFATPEKEWLGESQRHLLDLFVSSSFGSEFLDLPLIRTELARADLRTSDTDAVWRWISLVMWLKTFSSSPAGAHSLAYGTD